MKGKKGNLSLILEAASSEGLVEGAPAAPDAPKELRANNPEAERPKGVRNGMLLITYVSPHYRIGQGGARILEMQFAIDLTKDHKGHVPDEIEDSWKKVSESNPMITIEDVPPQTVTVWAAPDLKGTKDGAEYEFHIVGASIVKSRIRLVEQKGKGAIVKVPQLMFRAALNVTECDAELRAFATTQYGRDDLWLEIDQTQKRLLAKK